MTDVILFRPTFFNAQLKPPPIPWGLLYVGSSIAARGYSVKIVDELIHPDWRNLILAEMKKKTLLIGISSMTGKQIKYGLNLSAFVKEHSKIPVVWGGIHPSIFPEQTLMHKNIDYIVKGEGEETIIELIESLEDKRELETIRGLGYKNNNNAVVNPDRFFTKLDDLPELDYSLINVDRYVGKRFGSQRSFELCTSRGCPHQCAFCYNANYNKCKWRSMSVDRIMDSLHELIDQYEIDGLTWREDNFFVDEKRVKEIAERIIEEDINIRWHADCRIDDVYRYDDAFIKLLKKSGCHTLTLGAESGSNRILKKIKKGITRDQITLVKNKLNRYEIYQNYHFMMGLPDESDKDIQKTVDLMYQLMSKNKFFGKICGPSLYTPYPGTALYEESLLKDFNPPESLEGWIDMDWYSLDLPWITNQRRNIIEDIAWNVMGIGQKWVHHYFKWKFFLFAKYNFPIPCFEKKIYLKLRKN
ncbi:MAG: radical SAM protein [Candidatus Aminicenantes bacterium]|nr:radical SAM protein [Candidatus Aminicenantes bacterium]